MRVALKRIAFISGSLCYLADKLSRLILLICAFSALVILTYFVLFLVGELLIGADKTILAALIIAIFSFVTFLLSKYFEYKFQQITTLREHKTELYIKLSKMFFDLLKSIKPVKTKENKDEELDKIVEQIYTCNQELIVWGSDDVVSKFIAYRENVKNPDTIFKTMGNLFISIRKDLGHQNINLTPKNLLKIFVDTNEIDKSK